MPSTKTPPASLEECDQRYAALLARLHAVNTEIADIADEAWALNLTLRANSGDGVIEMWDGRGRRGRLQLVTHREEIARRMVNAFVSMPFSPEAGVGLAAWVGERESGLRGVPAPNVENILSAITVQGTKHQTSGADSPVRRRRRMG